MKNFDPRIVILIILVGIAIYKVTAKEKYMCGGKREAYETGAPIKKSGVCPKCGSTDQVYGKPCKCSTGGTEGYCSSCGMK